MDVLQTYVSSSRQGGPAGFRAKSIANDKSHSLSLRGLLAIFGLWKIVLFTVVCAGPNTDYDSSTALLFEQVSRSSSSQSRLSRLLEYIAIKLTRWDAIYFVSLSERGHLYEQEWAFSWALSKATSTISRVLIFPASLPLTVRHALTGILIANVTHLLSTVVLYFLVLEILPSPPQRKSAVASATCFLHILSPAGVFLSAPYGESTFALFNFLGLLSYVWALKVRHSPIADAGLIDAFWTTTSGVFFALAALVRSNALLSGLIFLFDAITCLPQLPRMLINTADFTRLVGIGCAGLVTALGFLLPQYVAYQEYCSNGDSRPWCSTVPPSIYNYVQAEYWGVGFLGYWTLSNLPLFVLATPMLLVLISTGCTAVLETNAAMDLVGWKEIKKSMSEREIDQKTRFFRTTLVRFAIPQLTLAFMALTSFHVQIVNRISSGYPLWYIVLAIASQVSTTRASQPTSNWSLLGLSGSKWLHWVVRGFIMYALIQAGLYACFLPPA